MTTLIVSLVVFLAIFTQSLSGFGSALVAMAILPGLLGIRLAAPLVSVVALTLEFTLLLRYYRKLNFWAVFPLVLASLCGIPIGILVLKNVNERIVLTILGIVIAGYAIYALFNLKLPQLHHPAWGLGAGFIAGILGGAYNTSGPPVIIYADCKRWTPAEFKSNLQGFFFPNSLLVVTSHALSGNLSPIVWRYYFWAFPAILVGFLAGTYLDKRLNPTIFRKIVLGLMVITGLRMILGL